MSAIRHWADVLTMRRELVDASGELGGLQMSLFNAVYQTQDVPYRDPAYYGDITQPTPGLVRFLAKIAHRLGSTRAIRALFHLDQGMGGGKSHALVGVYHMANSPEAFFATEIDPPPPYALKLAPRLPVSFFGGPSRVMK